MSEISQIEGMIRRIAEAKNIEQYFAYHDLLIDEFKYTTARAEAAEKRLIEVAATVQWVKVSDRLPEWCVPVEAIDEFGEVHSWTRYLLGPDESAKYTHWRYLKLPEVE